MLNFNVMKLFVKYICMSDLRQQKHINIEHIWF